MAEVERKSFQEQGNDGTGNAPVVDYEAKARESGWAPQEQFKGDPAKWIDAEQWVKRGESFIPFLQAANKGLRGKVDDLSARLEQTQRTQAATLKAIEELRGDFREQTTADAETRKVELTAAIVSAHAEGEIEKELELRDQLADVNEEIRAGKKTTPTGTVVPLADGTRGTPTTGNADLNDPRFLRFVADNPWFESDTVMAGAAIAVMGQLNNSAEGRGMTPEERFVEVARQVKKRFNMANDNPRRQAAPKVEGGRQEGSSGGSGGDQSFEALPAEARSMCDMLSKRFVGKVNGKGEVKYKDLAAYRAQYAADYFAEDWGTKLTTQQ